MRPHPSTPTERICITPSCSTQRSCPTQQCMNALQNFHYRRDTLAAADAGRRESPLLAASTQFEQQGQQQPRPSHPEWVAQCNRSTVDIHLLAIEAQFLFHREILTGERLVHF